MRLSIAVELCGGFLRALGVGVLGVVLGVYLTRAGINATRIGLVVGAEIAGTPVATATVSRAGARISSRTFLVILSLLAASGGIALASVPSFPVLLILTSLTAPQPTAVRPL